MSTILNLRIHSVKCKDETGGSFIEKFGNDEIFLGGFTIDPNGKTVKVPPFKVDPSFDDGDTKKFSPPRIFGRFTFSDFQSSKNFTAGFILIEQDAGGMGNAIQKVADKVEELIATTKQKEVEKMKLKAGNGTAAAIAIPFAAIWEIVKPLLIKFVFDKITVAFDDDIFPLKDVTTTLDSANHTFNGKKTSPIAMVEFRGHNGIYQLMYDWELN